MNKPETEEILPIVDDEGRVIGSAPRSQCHSDRTLLHPVVHLHVFNPRGDLYLQKRALTKRIQPGKWDTAVGGHIAYGEEILTALSREAGEEIGLVDFEPVSITRYKWQSMVESEMINVFATVTNKPLVSQNDEIDDARFWPLTEIRASVGKGVFTPNFEKEFTNIVDTENVARIVGQLITQN
ncbi:MAG: NUDIX domain-containing protein [Salinivirgaceae bacterium]|nr:NUDIX domain-containing protein [Salinivirgaceae bacterium]